jgi:hypothetical protein
VIESAIVAIGTGLLLGFVLWLAVVRPIVGAIEVLNLNLANFWRESLEHADRNAQLLPTLGPWPNPRFRPDVPAGYVLVEQSPGLWYGVDRRATAGRGARVTDSA